ncbi:hypothetical protein GCK72_011127 [Caenorhabditis remanei]|uniref:Uncharacterized protein n=1 Tax=Caenorhabditis remanei TaxID=31234 RepID=A0A6A5H7U0_CAERE|nr:hypothetical protein GCK72_011127 [Caenorhabditis remanei]KAF1762864.1 hypothetical protein GCK72_011127 [Caenorhabditis remanei]
MARRRNTEADHEEFIIVIGEVARSATLGDVSKCTYFSGHCKTPEATIAWSESTPFRMCRYETLGQTHGSPRTPNVLGNLPRYEIHDAVRSKQYAGKDMTEGPKGVYRSASLGENAENYTAWFGGKEVEHDEFIIVVGEVASFDGDATISTLGDTSKCSYSSGNCKTAEATVVWSESSPYRACKYQKMTSVDAFITDKHIAVPELKMFSTISQDMRFTEQEAKSCLVDLWNPDYVRMKQEHHRHKRVAYLRLGGPNNTTIAISLGEKFATPLIYKYFKVDAL